VSQRTVAVIVLALVFGMLAAFAVYQVATRAPAKTAIEEEEVYIAKETMIPGTMVDMANVTKKKFAKDRLPLNAIKDEKDLKDRMVKSEILQGEPINELRLAKNNERGLTPMFEPGERAYSCTVVDSASLGSGFILPQSFVDVLVTLKAGRGNDDPETRDSVTNMLLQRVQVLAIGTIIAPPKDSKIDDKGGGKLRTVTLRVKPDQAALLQHASTMGVLHLILRHPKDELTDMVKPVGDRMVRLPGSEAIAEVGKPEVDPGDSINIEKQLDVKVAAMEKSLMKRFEEQFGSGRKSMAGPDGEEIKATPVRVIKGTLTDWIGVSFEKPAPQTPAPPK